MKKFIVLLAIANLLLFSISKAQKPKRYNTAEIEQKLEKLRVLGNVLYVAAHPDDENTRLITYFANEKKLNTAYFSCTRGDGGQNLIGPEIRNELGVIRTQELLAARRIDNGDQFFSRAVDFGYSKNPDETFNIWDKEKVLGDLVWVIRKYRPDVIITRFNTVPGTTHGHHTASAILAGEAFDIAGDASKYPEQLAYVQPWQPKSLYWNTYYWRRDDFQKDTSELIGYDVGKYNKLLGQSYTEIAALSRSSHRSQGFGASGSRGVQMDYLQYVKGEKAEDDAFEIVDITWNKIKGGNAIDMEIQGILESFDPANPEGILVGLLDVRKKISGIDDAFWKKKKTDEIDEIIYAITGLYLEVKASDFNAYPGEEVDLSIEAINRSSADIILENIRFEGLGPETKYSLPLKGHEIHEFKSKITIPESTKYSQPYWLQKEHSIGMFDVDDQLLIGKPENDAAVTAIFTLQIHGETIHYSKPVIYKRNDPVLGEVYRPFVIAPPVYANISGSVLIFANDAPQQIKVEVMANKENLKGTVKLDLPDSWKIVPLIHEFELSQKGEKATFTFEATPPSKQETAMGRALVQLDGKEYDRSHSEINYEHIPAQALFNSSKVKFVKLDLEKGQEKIGYIMGAGDNIPDNLRQIGYEVDIINDMEFSQKNLDRYDVIILGIRALNTVERLQFDMKTLLDFVYRGGNLISQYNTNSRLVTNDFAPYPLHLSRSRVTVENAKVEILDNNHQALNFPNKITEQDFEGWVQERGLYFPDTWADEFVPLLSSHDPGEASLQGGLLVAKYGKGHYVYSGYSWFRELPAGVPGAYRIFVNLISLGNNIP